MNNKKAKSVSSIGSIIRLRAPKPPKQKFSDAAVFIASAESDWSQHLAHSLSQKNCLVFVGVNCEAQAEKLLNTCEEAQPVFLDAGNPSHIRQAFIQVRNALGGRPLDLLILNTCQTRKLNQLGELQPLQCACPEQAYDTTTRLLGSFDSLLSPSAKILTLYCESSSIDTVTDYDQDEDDPSQSMHSYQEQHHKYRQQGFYHSLIALEMSGTPQSTQKRSDSACFTYHSILKIIGSTDPNQYYFIDVAHETLTESNAYDPDRWFLNADSHKLAPLSRTIEPLYLFS